MPKPNDWVGEQWEGRKPGPYKWYEIQDSIDYYQEFEKPKIFYPDIAPKGYFTLDESSKYHCANSGYFIGDNRKYLLGLLNSKLITFYYRGFRITWNNLDLLADLSGFRVISREILHNYH